MQRGFFCNCGVVVYLVWSLSGKVRKELEVGYLLNCHEEKLLSRMIDVLMTVAYWRRQIYQRILTISLFQNLFSKMEVDKNPLSKSLSRIQK